MLYVDAMKEFVFDCQIRNLNDRAIRSYNQNVNTLFYYLKDEYEIEDIEPVTHKQIQLYFHFLRKNG